MTKRFKALTIAAALAAFAGSAAAQTRTGASPGIPGYAVSSEGRVVLSGFGQFGTGSYAPYMSQKCVSPPSALATSP